MRKSIKSAVITSSLLLFGACSENIGDDDNVVRTNNKGLTEETQGIAREKIDGLCEKGPFLKGSEVYLYELDSTTLEKTGKKFKSTIASDKGDFSFKDVEMGSRYALFEGSGYYTNDVTGKKSKDKASMYGIFDLKKAEFINVNFMTVFEYKRIMYLMTEKEMDFEKAKKQAEKEVLEALEAKGDFKDLANNSIFGDSDESAYLFAMSLVLQIVGEGGDINKLLESVTDDIEKDGKLDDVNLAEEFKKNLDSLDLEEVRKTFEKLDVGDVPDFEKFVCSVAGEDAEKVNGCDEEKTADTVETSACKATKVAGFTTWCGDQEAYFVSTGLDAGFETSGYWYGYNDGGAGGFSTIQWPVSVDGYMEEWQSPIIDDCKGLCGTFDLNKGSLEESPFVGVAFPVAGSDEGGSVHVGDASEWGGLCVAYSADLPISLELGLGAAGDSALAYDNPSVTLAKSAEGTVARFTWNDFVQAGWGTSQGGKAISGAEASKALATIKFKIQGEDGSEGSFNIMSVGPYEGGCGVTTTVKATPAVPASSSSIAVPESSSSSIQSDLTKCEETDVAGFSTWCGNSGLYRVVTGFDDGSEESGYWYVVSDSSEGGKSFIEWDVDLGNVFDDLAWDAVIDYCGGVCGTVNLEKGSMDYNPFVGVAFDVMSPEKNSTADASGWEGLCVAYSSDLAMTIELGLGEDGDAAVANDNPFVNLTKSSGSVARFTWNQFKQAGWSDKEISGAEAAKVLHSIKFRAQAKDGSAGRFNIMSVGPYEGGCGITGTVE
ncbi:MAG: hypothetical protein HUK19_08445 [Fibrobacter sp.]|nr:hypothetical protein [Fibrobacter sp.]